MNFFYSIPSLVFFSILFFSSLVSFGVWLIAKTKLSSTPLFNLSSGMVVSASLIASLMFLLGHLIGVRAFYFLLIPALIGLYNASATIGVIKQATQSFHKKLLHGIFLVIATISLTTTICFGGLSLDSKMIFQEVHDSVWHLSLIRNLQQSIPPAHPSSFTVDLSNYHYFYDLLLANLNYLSGFSLSILYFQFFPLIIASLLVSQAYLLGKRLANSRAGLWLVFFTVFGGSFAYFIPLFIPGQDWHESSFWVSQTFVMIVNPQIIFSFAQLLLAINMLTGSKLIFIKQLVIIFVMASSLGFKSYAWAVLAIIYATFLMTQLASQEKKVIIACGTIFLLISTPFLWLLTGTGDGSFFFHPLWFINSMIESPDRVNYLQWSFMEDHYIYTQNWARLIWLKTIQVAIFFIGNLGTRIFFVISIPLLYLKKKIVEKENVLLLVITGFLFSSIFPMLFLQKGTVWNSIQFWYYGLIFANILVAITLNWILSKSNKSFAIFTTIFIIALSVPTTIKTFVAKNTNLHEYSRPQIQWLSSLQAHDRVLVCPEGSDIYQTDLVGAFSPGKTYLVNPDQLYLVGVDKEIILEFQKIFEERNSNKLVDIITNYSITHTICSDHSHSRFIEESIKTNLTQKYQMQQVANWSILQLPQ